MLFSNLIGNDNLEAESHGPSMLMSPGTVMEEEA